MLKNPFGSHHNILIRDYMLCQHSILPETHVIRFEREIIRGVNWMKLGEIDWEKPIFEIEKNEGFC